MDRRENPVLTSLIVGYLLPMGGRNMAISKFGAKIWPKLDFFQIAPVQCGKKSDFSPPQTIFILG
jgi:hypothetical protein